VLRHGDTTDGSAQVAALSSCSAESPAPWTGCIGDSASRQLVMHNPNGEPDLVNGGYVGERENQAMTKSAAH
jgi:hypothetical protein